MKKKVLVAICVVLLLVLGGILSYIIWNILQNNHNNSSNMALMNNSENTNFINNNTIIPSNEITQVKVNPKPFKLSNIMGAESKIWIGTFQLVWNEFIDRYNNGSVVEFFNGNSDFVNELNKRSFTKENLSEDSYYINVSPVNVTTKELIEKDIQNKFNKDSKALKEINWNSNDPNAIIIYTMLNKDFNFLVPFNEITARIFAGSNDYVKYFGTTNASTQEQRNNIEVLFYNSENDFAVKLKTKEGEEVILYKTNTSGTFLSRYNEVNVKSSKYTGDKNFKEIDGLSVPYININEAFNYEDLCGKNLIGSGYYFTNAIQNIEFTLSEAGGHLTSEAVLGATILSIPLEKPRNFNFTSDFIIFLKEKDKELPYFALKIDNIDFLVTDI